MMVNLPARKLQGIETHLIGEEGHVDYQHGDIVGDYATAWADGSDTTGFSFPIDVVETRTPQTGTYGTSSYVPGTYNVMRSAGGLFVGTNFAAPYLGESVTYGDYGLAPNTPQTVEHGLSFEPLIPVDVLRIRAKSTGTRPENLRTFAFLYRKNNYDALWSAIGSSYWDDIKPPVGAGFVTYDLPMIGSKEVAQSRLGQPALYAYVVYIDVRHGRYDPDYYSPDGLHESYWASNGSFVSEVSLLNLTLATPPDPIPDPVTVALDGPWSRPVGAAARRSGAGVRFRTEPR